MCIVFENKPPKVSKYSKIKEIVSVYYGNVFHLVHYSLASEAALHQSALL